LGRPDGDQLYFHKNKIVTIGQELLKSWDGVNDPCWVTHKIGSATDSTGRKKFFATDVQILEPTGPTVEEMFLQAPELPLDTPEPVGTQSSVLSADNRKKTLLELVRQRREGK